MAQIGKYRSIAEQDKAYYESGKWKCDKSSTGAHHWLEVDRTEAPGLFYCKYCYDVRRFYITWIEADRRQKLKEVEEYDREFINMEGD